MLKNAIVRLPGENFHDGQKGASPGEPSYQNALIQHSEYRKNLKSRGLKLTILEADPRYPDGCFVEDAAVIAGETAIITNIGHPSRAGETEAIEAVLETRFEIVHLPKDATIDGGDVLKLGNHFIVGISKRTNQNGAEALGKTVKKQGFRFSTVKVDRCLHLKTAITSPEEGTVIIREDCKSLAGEITSQKKIIEIPLQEAYAANCLNVNGTVFIPQGFPESQARLEAAGFNLLPLPMSEFEKMNGGLTCLSLLF